MKSTNASEVLGRIRREIARQGWTQKDLAIEAGVSQGLISRWVRGAVKHPRLESLIAVAQALRLNVRLTVHRAP